MGLASESTGSGRTKKSSTTSAAERSGAFAARRMGRYHLQEELGRGATGVVYEARDTQSGAVVALKTLASMDAENLFRLKHEFRSLANFEHENLARFGELACEEGQWFFTMERIHGRDFLAHVSGSDPTSETYSPEDKERRLRGALAQLVEGLSTLHEAGWIHRDVKPSNVLVTDEGRVVVLDFGLMTGFGLDQRIVGTPAYMAPEQIACDALTAAADWYAVGAMLFVALTGRLPFEGEVPEILDAKLTADAPRDWGAEAPEDLRKLCVSLLARDPAARPGVDEIRSRLGLADVARTPAREVFVGRGAELELLRDALTRARSGPAQVVVRGEPGVGKSALVERLLARAPATTLILRGRCYEQESVPFGGVDSLIDALSEHLLSLDAKEVDRLLGALTLSNVARVFPVLCRVPLVDQQRAEGPVLNPTTLREQAFRELGQVISRLGRSRGLVVFVDDLQWVDGDSLALVRHVFLSTRAPCLFVATLRSGSVLPEDTAAFVESLETIDLARLSSEDSERLWRALGASEEGAMREEALREAAGHPLFLAELVRSERAGKLGLHASARLQDVLWDRIRERDPMELRFLEMASLAGAPAPYAVLARAAGLEVGECFTRLAGLRAAQLVRLSRVDDERCVEPYHDRVREAVMERVRARGDAHVRAMHLALGRSLLAAAPQARLASRVFTVVQHLNAGRSLMGSDRERRELAELDLLASLEAHRATAFERSRRYAATGLECLSGDAEDQEARRAPRDATRRDLQVALFTAEYMTLGRETARATFDMARAHANSPLDLAAVAVPWIELEGGNFPREAADVGCAVLRELGVDVPFPTAKLRVVIESLRARRAQRGRPASAFLDAPRLRDDTTIAVCQILLAMMPAAYFCSENLFPWIVLRLARITMTEGLSHEAPMGLAGYGMVLAGAFGRFADGAAFGRVALALARAEKDPRVVAKVEFLQPAFIAPWVTPFAETRAALQGAQRIAAVCGDTPYQANAVGVDGERLLTSGIDLEAAGPLLQRGRELALLLRAQVIADTCRSMHGYVSALRGKALADIDFPASELESDVARLRYHHLSAELAYLAGARPAAIEPHLAQVERFAHFAFANPITVDMTFLRALVDARACGAGSRVARARRIAGMARAARGLDAWAGACPTNFEAHALIVRAELLRVLGRAKAATAAFERAIASAERHRSPKREAIACELAMAHALAQGDPSEAARYRWLAVGAYRRWGATAKAAMLKTVRIPSAP